MSSPTAERSWVPLTPRERRVLGVLVEKAKTTPEYYPMTIAAIASPLMNFEAPSIAP